MASGREQLRDALEWQREELHHGPGLKPGLDLGPGVPTGNDSHAQVAPGVVPARKPLVKPDGYSPGLPTQTGYRGTTLDLAKHARTGASGPDDMGTRLGDVPYAPGQGGLRRRPAAAAPELREVVDALNAPPVADERAVHTRETTASVRQVPGGRAVSALGQEKQDGQ